MSKYMEPIQVFKKTEDPQELEYKVLLGHESDELGFMVKIDQEHWEELSDGLVSPEHLIKKSFWFLLKKQSKYSIVRSFHLREIQESFPEYEREVTRSEPFVANIVRHLGLELPEKSF